MARILIYDSGVGNQPIARSIRHEIPQAELHLLSDSAFFPYGERNDAELIARVLTVLDHAMSEIEPDILVLGCNTLSTIALDEIRGRYELPIVGVVPAIKPAAASSKTKVIGLLATPATIHRSYTDDLIVKFANDCEVIRIGSTELVHMAEEKVSGVPVDMNKLSEILQPIHESVQRQSLDQVILGCTHFPLLTDEISTILPDVAIQDSSAAIGRQVKRLAAEVVCSSSGSQHTIYLTRDDGTLHRRE